MKKPLIVIATFAVLLGQGNSAQAYDWFDHFDTDHNHHWSWDEYAAARHDWERRHHDEKRLSDEELRAEYDRFDHDHDHHLAREEAKRFGRW